MSFTAPSTRIASSSKLALLVAALLLLALTPQPAEAQFDRETLTQEFESRCAVEGSLRMIPLHPLLGGSVPPLVRGTGSVVRLDEPIPPGSYRVAYVSYDGYPGRESVRQSAETWVVEFYAEESPDALLGAVGPTKDLDDYVTEAYESSWPGFSEVTTITTHRETTVLAVKHGSPPGSVGPQSVRPICINLLPIDPIPIVPGNACGGADLVFRNPDVAYGSSYRKLWKNARSFDLVELNPMLPPGSYRLIAASYDGYDLRPGSVWETDEVWVAEFWSSRGRLVATSSPTMDLPDGAGHTEATWEGPLEPIILTEHVRRVTVRHAASSDRAPNSVYASCLGVSWVDEPSLEDVLRRSGLVSFGRSDNPTFAAGTYEMQILAEFTSGHATNAVGFFYFDSDQCQIVLDGSAGGPGFAGSDPVPFTADRRFGLCLQGASGTRYTTDALNSGGERAAVVPYTSKDHVVGFEDFLDGDFQDLVVRLSRPADTPILPGLPDAQPGSTVPWSEVDEGWLLTLVSGPWDQGMQPQGLYLVSPEGIRWAVHASVRGAPGDVMGPILDWRGDEALVLVSGPRDLVRIILFDLTTGQEMDVTDRARVDFSPKATFMGTGDDLLTDYTWAGDKRLIQQTRDRVEITSFGPPLPVGTPLDWINVPSGSDIVITNGLDVGDSAGQIIYVQRGTADTERIVALEECTPLRWLRPDELVAVCDGVGDTIGMDLWIVPMDGSPLWPVVDPAVSTSLGVDGFRDLYQTGDRLYLESAAGEIWLLEKGCPVLRRSPLHERFDRVDLVGADGPEVFFRHGQSLFRARFTGTNVVELLGPVGAIARSDNSIPTATGDFPTPSPTVGVSGFDTCPKQGPGQGALLTDIRWGLHPTFTRVVFEFEAEQPTVPSWWTRYIAGPVLPENPTGDPIEGEALLDVALYLSGTLDIGTPPENRLTYLGPVNIDVGVGVVEAIDIAEDWEGSLNWVITLDQRRPYKVFTLTAPPRLVIDFAYDG